jgi:hypothetical protein
LLPKGFKTRVFNAPTNRFWRTRGQRTAGLLENFFQKNCSISVKRTLFAWEIL